MIRFNLSIRELFIIFIIFLCYCVFVFYNTRNIKENFAVAGDECVKIRGDNTKCNNNPNCMVVPDPIEIKINNIVKDNNIISIKPNYLILLKIGDKIDLSLLPHRDETTKVGSDTVIDNINIANNSITLSKKISANANATLTFIRECTKKCSLYSINSECEASTEKKYCKWDYSTNKCNKKCLTYPKAECPPGRCKVDETDTCAQNDDSRKECSAFTTDKNCKLADHCNWNEGLNPPKCETNCGSYNYDTCNANSVCKWDDTRSSCMFDCSNGESTHNTKKKCNLDARCQWNDDNNNCQNRSAFHCAQHGNQWECNYNEQCEWNAKPTDGRAPRCDYKNCENIEDKDKCDKLDERCEWDNNNNKCTTTPGYSKEGGIDDARLDYFEKQKANFKIHQIFCDRLKRLDKPNKNNLIFKRFTKDFIDNKKKHVKILEDKIQNLHKRQHEITTYNYNINKIREHDQASKQVAAIKKGIENIKNKNKIKINLE